jgi:hypothetical protein
VDQQLREVAQERINKKGKVMLEKEMNHKSTMHLISRRIYKCVMMGSHQKQDYDSSIKMS